MLRARAASRTEPISTASTTVVLPAGAAVSRMLRIQDGPHRRQAVGAGDFHVEAVEAADQPGDDHDRGDQADDHDRVGGLGRELGVGDLRADVEPGQRQRRPERERREQHRDEDQARGQALADALAVRVGRHRHAHRMTRMSGHSKWSSIKHKKGAADAKRGKLFSKLARAIIVAARDGGGDIEGNPTLATAVQKAKDASMPKENIQRAIDRGTGAGADAAAIETVLFEGYGPGGAAILVEALTDNRNRTTADVRLAFTKHNGSLGEPGSVAWIFEKRGVVTVDGARYGEDDVIAAIDAGAEDVQRGRRPAARAQRAERAERRPRGARGRRGRDPVRRGDDGAEKHGRGRQRRRQGAARPARRARRARRRQRGPRQLRHPRGGPRRDRRPEAPPEGIRGSAQNHFPCKS